MLRFFFDTHSDQNSYRDLDGVEFASPEVAREEMMKALPGILRDELSKNTRRHDIKANIRNDAGHVIFTTHLSLISEWVD